jgi:2'-5' RNA ligase
MRVHEKLHLLLKERKLESDTRYHPENWIPHVTLTMGNENKKIKTIETVSQLDVFNQYRVRSISLINFSPVCVLEKFKLGQNHPLVVTPLAGARVAPQL